MPLSAGDKLGPYEILAPIGSGGMGEVYRAKDTTLKREVALKVLPEAFAADPGRMLRFRREAELLAALNHPHIASIYGLENGALAMELVEGESLPAPLPLDTALRYALQIAEALEYAHSRGVVHRDLKPANVKVTSEGVVKLLDFGLAKAVENPAEPGADPENSPTLTLGMTQAGVIMGTAPYMSPEQAAGKVADRRADIWSFGVVLYELLSGKRAFAGESLADTLACVLKVDPDFDALPVSTPAAIRKLVRRCLIKDRKQRLQAIGEARIVIEEVLSGAPVEESSVRAPSGRRILPWAVACVLAVVAVLGWAMAWRYSRVPQVSAVRLAILPGPEFQPNHDGAASQIISPDGSTLVYVGVGSDGQRHLYARRLQEERFTVIPETEGAGAPFFSPDGRQVGFFAGGMLKKASVPDGQASTLCAAPTGAGAGASWGDDGNIIVALAHTSNLSRISSSGGTPRPITTTRNEVTHRWPQVLPGAQAFLFTANTAGIGFDGATIEVQSLRTGQRKTLVRGGTYARYVPSGHLLYAHQGGLFAAKMDLASLELTGPPARIESVDSDIVGGAQYDVSATGTLLLLKPKPPSSRLVWIDRSGQAQPIRPELAEYIMSIAFSPDGKRLAYTVVKSGDADIWVEELDRGTSTRLTSTAGYDAFPVWSPDGRHIAFTSARHGGAQNLYWMRADGGGEAVRLTESPFAQLPSSFSPDGRWLAFTQVEPATAYDLWMLPFQDSSLDRPSVGPPQVFLKTPFLEAGSMFSPDGKWIAYGSSESGKQEIWVRPFPPGAGGKWQVSAGASETSRWSKTKPELVYVGPAGMMAVDVAAHGGTLVPGIPRSWAPVKGQLYSFDLAPDGKRVAAIVEAPKLETGPEPITVVLNFFDELRRKTAARR